MLLLLSAVFTLLGCGERVCPLAIIKQVVEFHSNVTQPQYYLCLSDAEVRQLGIYLPTWGLEINFQNEMCLLIFQGEKAIDYWDYPNKAGYPTMGLRTEVKEEPDRIIFRFSETRGYQRLIIEEPEILQPGAEPKNLTLPNLVSIITTPCGIFVLPRRNKKVIIEKEERSGMKGQEMFNWVVVKEFNPRR